MLKCWEGQWFLRCAPMIGGKGHWDLFSISKLKRGLSPEDERPLRRRGSTTHTSNRCGHTSGNNQAVASSPSSSYIRATPTSKMPNFYSSSPLPAPLPKTPSNLLSRCHTTTPSLLRRKYTVRCCGMNSSSVCSVFHRSSPISRVPRNRSS